MKVLINALVCVILITSPLFIFETNAQKSETNGGIDEIINITNSKYGINDILVNGSLYYPIHINAEGYPTFPDNEFQAGNISIKGNLFENEMLKYDTELDKLILLANLSENKQSSIVLNTEFIDKFNIGEHLFINAEQLAFNELIGYYELVYDNEFRFLIKHNKIFKSDFNSDTPYGIYAPDVRTYYILEQDNLLRIKSKKAFLNYFVLHKKDIRKYMRKHKIRFRKASSKEFKSLLQYCHNLSVK